MQEQRGPIARTSKVGQDLEITGKDTSKSKGLEVGLDLKGEVACLILQEEIDRSASTLTLDLQPPDCEE